MITHYILPIRLNRADRRKVVPKQAVFFTYRVSRMRLGKNLVLSSFREGIVNARY